MKKLGIVNTSVILILAVSISLILIVTVLTLVNAVDFKVLTDRSIGTGTEAAVAESGRCETMPEVSDTNECVLIGILQDIQNQKFSVSGGNAESLAFSSRNIVKKEFSEPVFFSIVALIFLSSVIVQFTVVANLLFSLRLNNSLDAWAIDSPPVLGICGTLYSLIQYLATLGGSSETSGFLEAFSFAAVTTLLGAAVSVVNHFFVSVSSLK